MGEPKPCLNPAHISADTIVNGDEILCSICGKQRLAFIPDPEEDSLDALMDHATVCWMAYYTDWSGIAVFNNEIDCLRHAVSNHMEVIELHAGDVNDQINTMHRKG